MVKKKGGMMVDIKENLIQNKDRKFGEANEYVLVKFKLDGESYGAFFTYNEIVTANERYNKNPEDHEQKSIFQKLR